MIFDGKKEAEIIFKQLAKTRKNLGKLSLALIAIGDTESVGGFISAKKKAAEKLDIEFRLYALPDTLTKKELRQRISQIVRSTASGVVLQLPIPPRYDTQYFLNTIIPAKDVDCLSLKSTGMFFTDKGIVLPPATEVIAHILKTITYDVRGKYATLVGYGGLVGKPIAHYLLKEKATISVVNSKTPAMLKNNFLENADLIISGAGKAKVVDRCKKNAVVIDFGYAHEKGKISGDVDIEKIAENALWYTPTPGGTGPLLVAMVYKNLLKLVISKK